MKGVLDSKVKSILKHNLTKAHNPQHVYRFQLTDYKSFFWNRTISKKLVDQAALLSRIDNLKAGRRLRNVDKICLDSAWLDRVRQRLLSAQKHSSSTQHRKLFLAVRAANVFGVGNFDSLFTQTGTDLTPQFPLPFSLARYLTPYVSSYQL